MDQGISTPGVLRGAIAVGRSLAAHFDVVAATWLIALAFAWAIYLASMSASSPSDWTRPLIGGGSDWNTSIVSTSAGSTSPAQPASNR